MLHNVVRLEAFDLEVDLGATIERSVCAVRTRVSVIMAYSGKIALLRFVYPWDAAAAGAYIYKPQRVLCGSAACPGTSACTHPLSFSPPSHTGIVQIPIHLATTYPRLLT